MKLLISKQDVVNMAYVPSEQMRAELVPPIAKEWQSIYTG